MVLFSITSPLSYLDNLVRQRCGDAARNDVLFHCPTQSPVLTGATTIHREVVVVSLDHGDVALRHPVVCVEDTHEAGHTLPDTAAPRDDLHARPELVLIDAHQQDGQRAEVHLPGAADHHVLHCASHMVSTLLKQNPRKMKNVSKSAPEYFKSLTSMLTISEHSATS